MDVEAYLRVHGLEAALTEAINSLQADQPANPFRSLASHFEIRAAAADRPGYSSPAAAQTGTAALGRVRPLATPRSSAARGASHTRARQLAGVGSPASPAGSSESSSPSAVPVLTQQQWRQRFDDWKLDPNRGMAPEQVATLRRNGVSSFSAFVASVVGEGEDSEAALQEWHRLRVVASDSCEDLASIFARQRCNTTAGPPDMTGKGGRSPHKLPPPGEHPPSGEQRQPPHLDDGFDLKSSCEWDIRASDRQFQGLGASEGEDQWRGEFTFVVAADTQFGFLDDRDWGGTGTGDWEEERIAADVLVSYVNQLEPVPKMLIICGDLVHNMPEGTDTKYTNPKWAVQQRDDFTAVFSKLRKDVPMVVLPGNHDVGNAPTHSSIEGYTNKFGDDYFAFWLSGVRCIVLNTQLFSDASLAPDLQAAQERWLQAILAELQAKQPKHALIFQHIPWFIDAEDEPRGYFNIPPKTRSRWLQAIAAVVNEDTGVPITKAVFCGHFHNNVVSRFNCADGARNGGEGSSSSSRAAVEGGGSIQHIITSSIGRQLARPECDANQDLGLASEFNAGLRVVKVGETEVQHEYVELIEQGFGSPMIASSPFPELWVDLNIGRPGWVTREAAERRRVANCQVFMQTHRQLASRLRKLAQRRHNIKAKTATSPTARGGGGGLRLDLDLDTGATTIAEEAPAAQSSDETELSLELESEPHRMMILRKILILLGPPGSGKGTHAPAIAAALRLPYISSGTYASRSFPAPSNSLPS